MASTEEYRQSREAPPEEGQQARPEGVDPAARRRVGGQAAGGLRGGFLQKRGRVAPRRSGGGGCSAVAFQEQPTAPLRLFRLAAADGSRSGQKMASGRHLTAVHALVPAGMSRPASIFRSMVLMDAE